MGMDVYEYIKNRRSVRKFLDMPVEWDKMSLMIDAAKSAPSAGNLQGWRFIVVTNRNAIRKIADAALHQTWLETAPAVIVACSDVDRYSKYYGKRGNKLYSIQDLSMAVANILVMAEAQGLGSCFIGAFEEEAVKRELKIPESLDVQALIAVGYADEKPPEPAKLHLRDVVFFETYGNRVRRQGIWPLEKHIDKGREALEVFTTKVKEKSKEVVDAVKEKVPEQPKEEVVEESKEAPKQEEPKDQELPEPPKQAPAGISSDVLEQIKQMKKKRTE